MSDQPPQVRPTAMSTRALVAVDGSDFSLRAARRGLESRAQCSVLYPPNARQEQLRLGV